MRVRGVDHLGITVPDIESATRYFVEALGAEVLYDVLKRNEPPLEGREVESWVGVSPGTAVCAIRLLRLHQGPSIELFEYKSHERKAAALPSDFGLQHLAVYVDDIQATAERVRDAGGFLLKGPVALPAIEGGAGNEFWYTRTPWGMTIELITYPMPVALRTRYRSATMEAVNFQHEGLRYFSDKPRRPAQVTSRVLMIKMIGGFIAVSTCLVAVPPVALRSETVQTESHKAVTFSRDVAPILYTHCVKCHHAGDIAPMSLLTYKEVRPWAAAIKQAVITRKMPPWKADEHYGEWSNDSRLPARDISILTSWADGQKLEGDQSEMPAPPDFNEGWRIGQPDLVISIPERKLAATGPDEYAYIDVPTHFTEDRWIKAAELRPGNRKIVHHAHVFVKEQENKAAASKEPSVEYARWLILRQGTLEWLRPEAPVIDNGCAVDDNGLLPGSKIANLGNLISSYLPGRDAEVFPDGTARLIKAGASLNFQIHYSRTSGKTEVDSTSVGFVFAKQPPMKVLHMTSISSQMFRIPAGDSDHRVTECHTFPTAIQITSLTPHMHLRGKAMRYVAHFPNGESSTLLYVPDYDFNWQFTYLARKPILIPKGTRIEVVAEFDNSANNPVNPNFKEPVRWGAASENEMMDGWIEYVDADVDPASSTRSAQADLLGVPGSSQQ